MKLFNIFSKKPKDEKLPGKDQPNIMLGAANHKDIISPSVIHEVAPCKDNNFYYIEMGSTAELSRYFRSYYAAFTGSTTHIGMMDRLYAGDFGEADCDVAIHILPVDQERTIWQLEQEIAKLEADYHDEGNSARRNTITSQINDLKRRHNAIRLGNEGLFLVSIQAMASAINMDAFKKFCNMLVKKYSSKGVFLRAADTRQLQALLSMTPLDKEPVKDVFRDMESSNIADLFPFGLGGLRHKTGIITGIDPNGNSIFYDCWDRRNSNYNMVIFGQSGSGKSFLVKLITLRSSYIGILTAIIDPEYEYENLMVGMGCPYIQLSSKSKYRINIFDVEQEEDEDGNIYIDIESAAKAVQAVVFKMIRTYDPNVLTGPVKVKIQGMIGELYAERGITEDPSSLSDTSENDEILISREKKQMPTLSDLYEKMRTDPELEKAASLLRAFTKSGGSPSQAIFDCQSNVDITNVSAFAISVKELDEEIMRPLGLFVATKWVWEKFGKNRKDKKRIITDEAQTMMTADSVETAMWLENAFRRARKRNISMCAITQGFEVFLRVPQGMGILKNASSKFFLRQESFDIEAVRDKFSLSEGEASFLLTAQKGDGVVKVENDASIFHAEVTPEEYRMFTSDPNDLM